MGAPEILISVCSELGPTFHSTSPQLQKSLSATWCMKAHCLLIQLSVTPDLICTDAIWPGCHHPFWPVKWIQWIFIIDYVYVTWFGSFFWCWSLPMCLGNASLWNVAIGNKYVYICPALRFVFECFFLLKKEGKSAQWVVHIVFFCFIYFLILDNNSKMILMNRFPARLLGKFKEKKSKNLIFIRQFWLSPLKIWLCLLLEAHMCSNWFCPAICTGFSFMRWSPALHFQQNSFFGETFIQKKKKSQLCNNLLSATAHLLTAWWFYGMVVEWWLLRLSRSLHHCGKPVCVHLPSSVSYSFPSEASQIVSARQQLYVPQREPKYPGNQASFSL